MEYIFIFLILFGLVEMNGVNVWWIYVFGVVFVVGWVLYVDLMFKVIIFNCVCGM